MKAFLRSFLASLLAIVVLFAVVAGIVYWKASEKSKIEDHSYLVVDIYGEVLEYDPPSGLPDQLLGQKPETLQRILSNLEKACVDERIEGVILKISSSNSAGRAMCEEVRGAVKKVRETGKKVYGFSDSIDRSSYYLAAACDSIFVPPTAFITFTGVQLSTDHVRGTLEKLGIRPNLHKIKDYKSAAEVVTRRDMSPEAREMYGWLLDESWEMYVDALSEDRGLSEGDVVEWMEHAAFTAEEARENGMVDRLLYWDEVDEMLKREKDEKLRTVSQERYAEVERGELDLEGKKTVAVVHAQGSIGGRESKVHPLLGMLMGHESVVADLRRAREDDDVAAVVFRVNSSGGEALASDLIGHEVEVTSRVKPIVASMVDLAASGGYHISYRASKIVADPMTLTGSIGSISMKFNVRDFHEKLGITHDFLTKGPMALMWSGYHDFSQRERQRFEQNHWDDFNAWLADVAEHRGMSFEAAERLAHGRVWTGRQGKANGLVDELGGLDRAVGVAKELAGIAADEQVTIVHYPAKKGLIELLLGGDADVSAAIGSILCGVIRSDLAETWRILTQGLDCRMEPVRIE